MQIAVILENELATAKPDIPTHELCHSEAASFEKLEYFFRLTHLIRVTAYPIHSVAA